MSAVARHVRIETTTGSAGDAKALAGGLVARRLVACAQIVGPIRSVYRWEGAVHDDEEHLLVLKTRAALVDAVKAAMDELHPYDVPELVVVSVTDGSPAYLDWIDAQTTGA